ncbi:hypothetical protein ACFVH7_31405 [Kitasatospora indigofera]|uniref:hypothetical protein n=1 Tax=Kitasatospora indigofera TaxID=67307 RepID=UPI003628DA28
MDDTTAAIRRAYLACVETRCTKCRVAPGQHCRNSVAGVEYNAHFHKPRQVEAGAPAILESVGIRKLTWLPRPNSVKWDGSPMPELPAPQSAPRRPGA